MKVSVIVIAYNIEKYIERCLKSILIQSLKEIEIIIVNDGSNDNTLNIINKLIINDNRVKVINQKNKGIIEARKSGIKVASGEYILFVDGDDWIELNTCEILYKVSNENNLDILIYNAFWVYQNRKVSSSIISNKENIKVDPLKNLFLGKILPAMWGKLIRREFLNKIDINYPSNINYGEDLATVTSWFINKPKIDIIDDYLYNYYQRDNSITNKVSNKFLDIIKAIDFIEEKLKETNLYDKYKEEFEFMAYNHLFILKFICVSEPSDVHIKIYDNFKEKHIKIFKNKYILDEINKDNIYLKIRIILYLFNLKLGKAYDFFRKKVKLIFI
ncbi:glycosyltransferase [Clostridium celatum]|uniref:glycosyltransferase family 2 protein n=1 Tax=Clostridium celatum TaxID=36834 RepID=UPI0028FE7236|nr:glycosyltransferase [Clostridium celatum]MDU2265555.1 glycosyltransferase [Clostridium celatum]MDU6295411.1 glycosyltransferase [Clostridium celatum]